MRRSHQIEPGCSDCVEPIVGQRYDFDDPEARQTTVESNYVASLSLYLEVVRTEWSPKLYLVSPFYNMRSQGKTQNSTECVGVQGSIFTEFEKNGFSGNGNHSKVIKKHASDTASFYAQNIGGAMIALNINALDANALLPFACVDEVDRKWSKHLNYP